MWQCGRKVICSVYQVGSKDAHYFDALTFPARRRDVIYQSLLTPSYMCWLLWAYTSFAQADAILEY